jgi:hypothetical protein
MAPLEGIENNLERIDGHWQLLPAWLEVALDDATAAEPVPHHNPVFTTTVLELVDNELIGAESQFLDDDRRLAVPADEAPDEPIGELVEEYDPDAVGSLKFVVTAAGRRFAAESSAKA